jgi:putative ABC transport system ATP-binding protein
MSALKPHLPEKPYQQRGCGRTIPHPSSFDGVQTLTSTALNCILRTENLSKVYPDGSVNALVDVSLQIPERQFLAIMGPSGSGKSTLLNLLGGLDLPTSGSIYFRDQPLADWHMLDRYRSEQVGFVFQSFHLLPTFTATENVQIPMFTGRRSSRERERMALELLELVGLSHRARHLPSQLSVGERQRVSIARALANSPPVLLADEPTGNLDTKTGGAIMDLFEKLRAERGVTPIVVTHTPEVSARAERLLLLRDGRIVSDELQAHTTGVA